MFTLLYRADHHEIHIFIISSSSQFPEYITNQFNDQLSVGLLVQLVTELHGYHRWSSFLLYLHFAVPIYEFHLFIFSCHLVFQILHCLTTRLLEGRLFNMKNYDQPSMVFSWKLSYVMVTKKIREGGSWGFSTKLIFWFNVSSVCPC